VLGRGVCRLSLTVPGPRIASCQDKEDGREIVLTREEVGTWTIPKIPLQTGAANPLFLVAKSPNHKLVR